MADERTMTVQIVSVELDTELVNQSGKKYTGAEVIYKTKEGKTNTKCMANTAFKFNKTLRSDLEAVGPKDYVEVVSVKNGDFVNWVSVKKVDAPVAEEPTQEEAPAKTTAAPAGKTTPPTRTEVRSSYETPEERAQRQIYIVRQSSLERAIQLAQLQMKAGGEFLPDEETIIESAKIFEAYVLDKEAPKETTEVNLPD